MKLSLSGNFKLRDERDRADLTPKTSEAIPVTARRAVTFKPGSTLKQHVAERGGLASRAPPGARSSRASS